MELLIKGGVDLNQAANDVNTRPIAYVSLTFPNTRHTHGDGGGGDGALCSNLIWLFYTALVDNIMLL